MIGPYAGPRVVSPEYNKDELDRVVSEVNRIAGEAQKHVPALPALAVIRSSSALKFDTLNRVDPPAAGLTVPLPEATASDGGREVEVVIMSAAGAVTFIAPGKQVNRAASYAPGAAIGLLRFRFDGAEWWV